MVDGTGIALLTLVSDGVVSEVALRVSIDGGMLSLREIDDGRPVAAVQIEDGFHDGLRRIAARSATTFPLDALHAIHLEPRPED